MLVLWPESNRGAGEVFKPWGGMKRMAVCKSYFGKVYKSY